MGLKLQKGWEPLGYIAGSYRLFLDNYERPNYVSSVHGGRYILLQLWPQGKVASSLYFQLKK